ncbi:latent-transforming growth factor beta-binding protein 4-like, partial [Etheostoma cragini]|uniref:latent-transforming growth factor beta-binding protein 4-like n=1 Tax=Etheostoma cragini TaxID=417921 RepID=UPI00155F2CB4
LTQLFLSVPPDENLSLCWQHVTADLVCQSPLLGAQVTFMDCCCLYGEGWGMECALCPPTDSEDYSSLCSSFLPLFPDPGAETGVRPGAGRGRGGAAPPYPPYSPDSFPAALPPDYEDYSAAGGSRTAFRGRTPDGSYGRQEYSTGYYPEGDFGPPDADPRAERGFGARPPPPARPDAPPLSLSPYELQPDPEDTEEPWRPSPPFTGRQGGGTQRRVYE